MMVAVPASAATVQSTITVTGTAQVGQSIVFTETFPKEAARQSRQPQYPNKPTTQINCDGWAQWTNIADKHPITGGWEGTTYPITLEVAGQCGAVLYSFDVDNQLHVWAYLYFEVAP